MYSLKTFSSETVTNEKLILLGMNLNGMVSYDFLAASYRR